MVSINGDYGSSRIDMSGFKNLKPLREINSGSQPIGLKNGTNTIEKDLDKNLAKSPLDDRIPNKSTLKKLGFNVPFPGGKIGKTELKSQDYLMDMNGGRTYQNKNGDTIRICEFDGVLETGMEGATSVEYKSKDGSMRHKLYYDPDGNPMKGTMTVQNKDGSIETFEFEYDLDGNKKVTSYNKMVRG